ncbi:hypothetical protein JCM8208_006045 [Rhodotorula glutinis]
MQRQPTNSSPRTHTQGTPHPRAPLHPVPSPSSSLNPSVVVVKPAVPAATATYHRFRRPGHLTKPSSGPNKPRASDILARPDSPPPASSSAPRPAPPQHVEQQQGRDKSSSSRRRVISSAEPDGDNLKSSAVRSPLARRSAAVQTNLAPSPVHAASRYTRFADEQVHKQALSSTEASSSSSPAAKIDDSSRGPTPPPNTARAVTVDPVRGTRTRTRPTSLPRLSTAHLSPFQRHLGTDRDVFVELLSSGELVVDPRRRELKVDAAGQDELYLLSGNGDEMRVFRPSTTLSTSAALVLVHPSTTYSYSDLLAVASPTSRVNSTQRRHAKAYRTATRIIAALKARVPLMSFYHPEPPLALADRVKVTVYADLESFSCSATVGDGRDRGLATALVCPGRASLVLTVPTSPPRAPSSTFDNPSRLSLPISAFSARSGTPDTLALLPPNLPPAARALAHCAAAPSTLALVERARAAHLGALPASSGPAGGEREARAARRGPSGATKAGSSLLGGDRSKSRSKSPSEERVVRALARTLGVAPPSPARGRDSGADASREGRGAVAQASVRVREEPAAAVDEDEDERCLPGLGWVLREGEGRARSGFGKAEEAEAGWRILFADGEELRMRLCQRRHEPSAGGGGRGGTTSEGDEERDEVELLWRGERYPLQRDNLPTRLVRRLPLALELLALFLPDPAAPP